MENRTPAYYMQDPDSLADNLEYINSILSEVPLCFVVVIRPQDKDLAWTFAADVFCAHAGIDDAHIIALYLGRKFENAVLILAPGGARMEPYYDDETNVALQEALVNTRRLT